MAEELDDLLDPGVSGSPQNGGNPVGLVNSTAVLVLGICSIVGCFMYGLPGLICGIIALILHKKTKEVYLTNPAKYEMAYKNAKAGYICAIIGTSLSATVFLIMLIWLIFVFTTISTLSQMH